MRKEIRQSVEESSILKIEKLKRILCCGVKVNELASRQIWIKETKEEKSVNVLLMIILLLASRKQSF